MEDERTLGGKLCFCASKVRKVVFCRGDKDPFCVYIEESMGGWKTILGSKTQPNVIPMNKLLWGFRKASNKIVPF